MNARVCVRNHSLFLIDVGELFFDLGGRGDYVVMAIYQINRHFRMRRTRSIGTRSACEEAFATRERSSIFACKHLE